MIFVDNSYQLPFLFPLLHTLLVLLVVMINLLVLLVVVLVVVIIFKVTFEFGFTFGGHMYDKVQFSNPYFEAHVLCFEGFAFSKVYKVICVLISNE